ncbi:hypothetical protein EYF80_031435 [Liparis tanakae]|uniref:Uncharacterized protein n=1 Tax=Liparis tanakae TaxID=230148 RepID=A0A4Z2GZX0_9TELE|nr:hypothetical protein EYF80_031435 [Liparis tanakae]
MATKDQDGIAINHLSATWLTAPRAQRDSVMTCCGNHLLWITREPYSQTSYCQFVSTHAELEVLDAHTLTACRDVTRGIKLGTHPHKVADRRLHRGHRHRQIRDGFTIHLPLLVHDDQVGDLLGHRLQDTLDGFGVKHRHRERLLTQPR